MKKIIEKLEKTYKGSIRGAKETPPDLPRIPSGVFIFDALTGGGVPLWKFSIFHGVKSSGKTTQGLRVIGNFLELYPDKQAIYVDFENSYDPDWAKNFIEEESMERMFVASPDYGEEGVDLTVELAKQDEVGFIFIDSLAMMIPTVEATNSALDDTMGLQAKLVNKMIRKLVPILSNAKKNNRPLTVLLINQLTSNMGATKFSSGVKKPCGYFQDFVNSLDVRFYLKEYKMKGDFPTAGVYSIKIEKGKVKGAIPNAKGEFKISLVNDGVSVVGEPLDAETILSYAKRTGVLERRGNSWGYGENVFKNLAEILDRLYQDRGFRYQMGDAVLKQIYEKGIFGKEEEE